MPARTNITTEAPLYAGTECILTAGSADNSLRGFLSAPNKWMGSTTLPRHGTPQRPTRAAHMSLIQASAHCITALNRENSDDPFLLFTAISSYMYGESGCGGEYVYRPH